MWTKLREQFGHLEIQDHLVKKQTDNYVAYEYYLKAKFHKNKWNPEDVKTAISLFNNSLNLDPKHAESLLGLADCYSFLGTTAFMPFDEAWNKTIKYTQMALEINDQLSEGHFNTKRNWNYWIQYKRWNESDTIVYTRKRY